MGDFQQVSENPLCPYCSCLAWNAPVKCSRQPPPPPPVRPLRGLYDLACARAQLNQAAQQGDPNFVVQVQLP